MSEALESVLDELWILRGNSDEWMQKEKCILDFIAKSGPDQRILARGEHHGQTSHLPAVLIYNTKTDRVEVVVPTPDCSNTSRGQVSCFFPRIPACGIAREVLTESTGANTI